MHSKNDPSMLCTGVGKICITNFDHSVDEQALKDAISACETILWVKWTVEDDSSKNFDFLCFDTQEAANVAMLNICVMLQNGTKVYVDNLFPQYKFSPSRCNTQATQPPSKGLEHAVPGPAGSQSGHQAGPSLESRSK